MFHRSGPVTEIPEVVYRIDRKIRKIHRQGVASPQGIGREAGGDLGMDRNVPDHGIAASLLVGDDEPQWVDNR